MAEVQRAGYAHSRDEVMPGLRAVAVPLEVRGYAPMTVAVVYVTADLEPADLATRLTGAAAAIRRAIEGP